ncbi:cupin domain-containing protein [Salisaeta longa]|uniref:cupin domain-containing protein n=1 Tax=Salisaeta longa TaxID=503170 RepID=UPI0003B61435|nr:cupin domain-containing protein [Salisaeta longa]
MPVSAPLGDLTPDEFLSTYWQKRPVVIRDALPDVEPPLSPDEMAGLACEPDVESRLIEGSAEAHNWTLRDGPFTPEDFAALPATHWTLLVQQLDRLLPAVEKLRSRFRFIPDWRIDDVMASYAPRGGSVGPHIDHYDVFLLQMSGERRWHIGAEPVVDETLVPDADLRVLADFTPAATHDLTPGDMLYLPPRVAHHGISRDDDCMTFSIGFRAPSVREALYDFAQFAYDDLDERLFYRDPDLMPTAHPGQVDAEVVQRFRALFSEATSDAERIRRWIGLWATRTQAPEPLDPPCTPADVQKNVGAGRGLQRHHTARIVYTERPNGSVVLTANGTTYALDAADAFMGPFLTDRMHIPAALLAPYMDHDAFVDVLAALVTERVFTFVSPDDALTD